jgi:hypothetical protein
MEITVIRTEKVQVKSLKVEADVRYWEDAEVNGITDETGEAIPCRVGDAWCPVIDLETGVIAGWPENTIARIHYKVCDAGRYALLGGDGQEVVVKEGYVPTIMAPGGSGYGDYIIMNVGPTGVIENWDNREIEEFEGAEE